MYMMYLLERNSGYSTMFEGWVEEKDWEDAVKEKGTVSV